MIIKYEKAVDLPRGLRIQLEKEGHDADKGNCLIVATPLDNLVAFMSGVEGAIGKVTGILSAEYGPLYTNTEPELDRVEVMTLEELRQKDERYIRTMVSLGLSGYAGIPTSE